MKLFNVYHNFRRYLDKAGMASLTDSKTFVLSESVRDELFLTREDCRGYCIRVPGDELMAYARSVQGRADAVFSYALILILLFMVIPRHFII